MLAIARDGSLWSWGDNAVRQSGRLEFPWRFGRVPLTLPAGVTVRDAAISSDVGVAATSDGVVHRWGRFDCVGDGIVSDCGLFGDEGILESPVAVVAPIGDRVVGVTTGGRRGLALTSTGRVWGWGANDDGELGDGTRVRRDSPVVARPPFRVGTVTFDSRPARVVGERRTGRSPSCTPPHASATVDVAVRTIRPDGSPGPGLRFSGAFTYGPTPFIVSDPPPPALTRVRYRHVYAAVGPGPTTYAVVVRGVARRPVARPDRGAVRHADGRGDRDVHGARDQPVRDVGEPGDADRHGRFRAAPDGTGTAPRRPSARRTPTAPRRPAHRPWPSPSRPGRSRPASRSTGRPAR